jgi:hypothetical protein
MTRSQRNSQSRQPGSRPRLRGGLAGAAGAVLLAASLAATMAGTAAGATGASAAAPSAAAPNAAPPAAATPGTAVPAAKSAWSIQHVPPLNTNRTIGRFLDVSCPTDSSCLAAGWFIGTDGTKRPLAERWDSRGWHILATARPAATLSSTLDLISCVSPDRCQAIGSRSRSADGRLRAGFIAETWNGSRWRMVPIPRLPNTLLSAISCATASACFAVGVHFTTSSRSQAVSLRWNGTRWSAVQPRRPRASTTLDGVSCPGPRNCYAVGSANDKFDSPVHPLVEHWNGQQWSTRSIPKAPRNTSLHSVSCPSGTVCTAAGSAGRDGSRLLVADLSKGTWRTSGVASPPQAAAGFGISFTNISCSAPRVCTAIFGYVDQGEALTWATASRGPTGGFRVTVPARDVSSDFATGISCQAAGCTLVGAKDASDGRGDDQGTGTAFAWRGQGGHFVTQTVPLPPGTEGGRLSKVSCAGAGFCAATTLGADSFFDVPAQDPSAAVRPSQHGAWRYPPSASHGFLSGLSCPETTFCLALGSAAGAQRWDGQHWAPAPAPGHPNPMISGMQELSCTSPTFCLAVGMSAGNKGKAQYSIWNGSGWTPIASAAIPAGSRLTALTGVSCTSPKFCVAAGVSDPVKGRTRGLIEIWNGTKWVFGTPRPLVNLTFQGTDVSCATPSACMVNWGDSFEAIARWWNGKTWTGAPYPGPGKPKDNRSILGVSCPSATSCYGVGTQIVGRTFTQLIEHWNGQRWFVVPPAPPGIGVAQLNDVSCTTPTRCTAVGYNTRLVDIPFAVSRP